VDVLSYSFFSLDPLNSIIMIQVFFALNLAGFVLIFTQVNALLYICKAKEVSVPPRPTQTGADPQVASVSIHMRA
jgi:hypothetical protein